MYDFKENILLETCNPASPDYGASPDLNKLSEHLLIQNETWSTVVDVCSVENLLIETMQ